MFTNMLSKILEENRNIDVIVGKMIAEKLMNENDTVMVIDTVNHNCEEVYQEDYFLDGTRKMVRMSKDTVVFTNCNKSIEEMDDELQKYHCIRYDGYIYDASDSTTVSGEDEELWFNALWDEGDIRKNIPFISDHSEWSKEELEDLDNGTLAEIFWDAWYNA